MSCSELLPSSEDWAEVFRPMSYRRVFNFMSHAKHGNKGFHNTAHRDRKIRSYELRHGHKIGVGHAICNA